MSAQKKHPFLYRNSLSITLLTVMLIFWAAQFFAGWKTHNAELTEKGQPSISSREYLSSGHFISATFENWESEFLQMGIYILLTVSLRQQGSSESKKFEGEKGYPEPIDREPRAHKDAPWPVHKGGIWLFIYRNSLSIAFIVLFLLSFWFHFQGSLRSYNEEQRIAGLATVTQGQYITHAHFWFESFQNWQSEFLAVAAIVLLSIRLRQYGSPESKPVDASHRETGN